MPFLKRLPLTLKEKGKKKQSIKHKIVKKKTLSFKNNKKV